jgi:hypothetical protein
MIRVCILSQAGKLVKTLLNGLGFDAFVGEENKYEKCDVVVADRPMNISKPVVVYDEKVDLGDAVIKASVAKLYAPLHDSINESLEMVRKK